MTSISIYQPLGKANREIRLLRVDQHSDSETFRCRLIHTSLGDTPPYLALSYTWQNPTHEDDDLDSPTKEVIEVNGSHLSIPIGLYTALSYLKGWGSQLLWIDAVCVNQEDLREREDQVMLMRSIYKQAQTVLVWLGPESDSSNQAMALLRDIAQKSSDKNGLRWLLQLGENPSYLKPWEALASFFRRKWWRRAWAIQEFVLAQEIEIACGEQTLSCEELSRAYQLLFEGWSRLFPNMQKKNIRLNARNMEPLQNLLSMRDQLQNGCTISLLECLFRTREALASDTRDNIFSKLGLVETSAAAIAPRPNYHQSSGEVQVELVKNFLKREQDLYIICLAGVQAKQHQSPSWLPDWGPAGVRPFYPLRCSWGRGSLDWPTYKAAGATIPSVKLCSEIKIECEGVLFDEIDGFSGDPWGNSEDQRLVRQSKSENCRYTTQETAFTALWRTVVANTNRWGEPSQAPKGFGLLFGQRCRECDVLLSDFGAPALELSDRVKVSHTDFVVMHRKGASNFEKRWQAMRMLQIGRFMLRRLVQYSLAELAATSSESTTPLREGIHLHPLWAAFEHSMGQIFYHRRLFTTVKGYLGVGPQLLRDGDNICILLGCSVPVILRSAGQGYSVIGECYIDGIMDGEVMGSLRAGDAQLRSFALL